jgi:hypothetical protein
MPTYTFRNKLTGEILEDWMTIAQRESFLKKNKDYEMYIETAPGLSYSGTGDIYGAKTDNTWKEVMAKIAEQNPRSPLAAEHRRRTTKEVKTDQVIEKHMKKRQQQKP